MTLNPIEKTSQPTGSSMTLGQLPRVLSPAELHRYYGLPKSTQHYWRKRGDFPNPIELGKRKRIYLTSDIEAWVQSRKVA